MNFVDYIKVARTHILVSLSNFAAPQRVVVS